MSGLWRFCAFVIFGLALSGCQSYRASPLIPREVVDQVDHQRHDPGAQLQGSSALRSDKPDDERQVAPPLTFARATALLEQCSPTLKEANAEYQTALALAKVKTPISNPALEIGPQYGFGPDVGKLYRLQPFGSIGFTIPTGGKRKRQDELNRITAELFFIELQAKHRELYLSFRKTYSQWSLSMARLNAWKKIAESADASVGIGRKLVEGGFATSLDIGILELEAAKLKSRLLDARIDHGNTEGEMSEMIGVHTDHFQVPDDSTLPILPESSIGLSELREIMIANHPELARLRARYDASDAELKLEISKQYPDFHFGPSFESEVGEKKSVLGLTLGIELPLFDRNQQAIATADKRREEIRTKYEAAANRALAALEKTWRSIQVINEKLRLLQNNLLPKANANIELARKSLEAGATDALRFLETERGQRAVLIEAQEAELSVREAWVALEQAVGIPLIQFPGEMKEAVPDLSEASGPPEATQGLTTKDRDEKDEEKPQQSEELKRR